MLLTLVVGIIVLSVIVLVHELGHYMFAKATHCYVEEFGLGFPPRIWGKKIGETIYSINWIPFGGFNRIAGEVDPKVPRALAARSHAVRALVISGGIIMNLLLPFLLMIMAYMVPHDIAVGTVTVREIAPNSPAEMAGIVPGDTILSVDGQAVNNVGDLSRFVQLKLGHEIDITVKHSESTETVTLVPRAHPPEGQGAIGTLSETVDPVMVSESLPVWRAIPKGIVSVWETLVLYKNGLVGMITGSVPVTMTGPVGVVQYAGEVAKYGISPVLELAAVISIAIAVTQIIPFPALDGSHLLFIFIEWIRRGKRISTRVQTVIQSAGFFILIGLMVVLTYQDIVRWVTGSSLLGG